MHETNIKYILETTIGLDLMAADCTIQRKQLFCTLEEKYVQWRATLTITILYVKFAET